MGFDGTSNFGSTTITGTWGNVPIGELGLKAKGEQIDPNRIRLDISDEAWSKLGNIGCSPYEHTLTREQCEWLAKVSRGRLGSFAEEISVALVNAGFKVNRG